MMTTIQPARLAFHKMEGAGNDFVLLDLRDQSIDITAALAQRLADRHRGVGCDQLLVLRDDAGSGSVARYDIRNADGSAAGQCGNGARCIGLYLFRQGEVDDGQPFQLDSPSGPVRLRRCADGEFEVDMGEPAFAPADVPLRLVPEEHVYRVASEWGPVAFGAVSMGNPHALIEVPDIDSAPLSSVGEFIGRHPAFPDGCNVGFAQVLDAGAIRLRVLERGAGETLACGSGACAAVALLRRAGRVHEAVRVFLPGGVLVIKWSGPGGRIVMKGPATHVFEGSLTMSENA